ncbi:MAG: TolC family protein [Verrucomicrobia bacterium]|nr:TolC family protein [Verrucomicrobiota bacterium]
MKTPGYVLLCLLLAAAVRAADAPTGFSVLAEHHPVTLAECYAQTLEQNLDIRRQHAGMEAAAGAKMVFTARALPRASMSGTAGYSGGSLYGPGGPFAVVQTDVSQPLFDMGMPASLRRGRLEVIIAQQTLNGAVTAQLHATRLAFVRALAARRLFGLHQQIETHLQANVRSAQQRFDAGIASRQHVRQAEIQLLNLKPALSKAQRDYVNAVTELDQCRGTKQVAKGPLLLPEPTGSLEYAALKIDLEKETAQTLQRRPDLALLRELIKAAGEEKRMVQAGYYPFVALRAFSQYFPDVGVFGVRPEIVSGQDARQSETRYGAAFTWQVIDAGKIRGAASQVESARQTMEITLRRLEENVPRELRVLARTLETIDARLAALKQSASEAEELLKLVEARVKLGEATQLDFLNAQTNLLSTQRGILLAVFENETARAEFDRVTGRYLNFSDRPAK